MSSHPRTIVIVGAGFSGTALAVSLLQRAQPQPLRIVLLDRSAMARGVAYARRPYPYLLNVPAGRMSANAPDPAEFLTFAHERRHDAGADDFLPRELYGDYLEASLRSAESEAPCHVELECVRGQAVEIERFHRTTALCVHLAGGGKLHADAVVLAVGNPPPAPLPGAATLQGSSGYVADPWQTTKLARAGESILVVGTGLTAADTILAADHGVRGKACFHAISRHGLLPPPQAPFRHSHHQPDDAAGLLRAAAVSLPRLVRAVRALAADIEARGGDWREAIAFVREVTPALWQRLSMAERRRFLRHVRCYWDVHRHRLPDSVWQTLRGLRHSDRLRVDAGRIIGLNPVGPRIRLTWQPRGRSKVQSLLFDRVINCTGPDYDVRRSQDRLLRTLVAQGAATPDPLGLGLVTDRFGALVDGGGRAARNIYYVGPMLRASYWETTAVAELRQHVAELATHLCNQSDEWQSTRHVTPQAGFSARAERR
jgi:uncharacterized NAD(P)/FAD-binding protein YdhS